jgi:predicted membrane channel-forming protein YqfA (hemolysin III family)
MTGRDAHRAATFVLSLLMAAIGVALIVQVADGHGSVASARLLLGVLFLAAGGGRIYLERKRARQRGDQDVG